MRILFLNQKLFWLPKYQNVSNENQSPLITAYANSHENHDQSTLPLNLQFLGCLTIFRPFLLE